MKARLFSLKYFLFDFMRIIVIGTGMLIYRPKILYENDAAREKIKGGALLVSNHLTLCDPVFLQVAVWYRRHHFVIAKELCRNKAAALFFKIVKAVPVDRIDFNIDSFRSIVDRLKEERLVTIFAEGHINEDDGKLDEFKSGMVLMSLQSGKPIVPIYMKKREHFYQRMVFVVGEKIELKGKDGKRPNLGEINNFTKQIREKEIILKNMSYGRK